MQQLLHFNFETTMLKTIKNILKKLSLYTPIRDWVYDKKQSYDRRYAPREKTPGVIGKYNWNVYPFGTDFMQSIALAIKPCFNGLDYLHETPVASIGTCFAEEFSSHMKKGGRNYLYIENNINNSSANWGRVYTIPNLLQIIKYSLNDEAPIHIEKSRYGYFDPFRERGIGYKSTQQEAYLDTKFHRDASRKVFSRADILVITLGQNEAWYDKNLDIVWGSVPPREIINQDLNRFSPVEFKNSKNTDDLSLVIEELRKINNKLKIIFTISPVGAAATFLQKDVVSQSFAGKCNLRTCVHEVMKDFEELYYFPSFEIVLCDNERNFCADNVHVQRHCVKKIFTTLDSVMLDLAP